MDRIENPFLEVLRLPVKTSATIVRINISLHIICLLIPWFTALDVRMKIILTSVVIVSFCFYQFRYWFYMANQCVEEVILNAKEEWQIKMNNGAVHHAKMNHYVFVHRWLTIIKLEFNGFRQYFIFTPENLDENYFRRLRVRLRFKAN